MERAARNAGSCPRWTAWRSLAVTIATLWAGAAMADAYPTRPITLINPWPAGGPADIVSRPLAAALTKELGQAIVVSNRAGSGGVVGTTAVATAKPDGYTLLLSHVGPNAMSPALQAQLPYDALKSFRHISLIASGSAVLAVNPRLPVRSIPELVDYARKNPGLLYGSTGVGTNMHLAGELLKMKTGIDIVHVPYPGAAPNIQDMIGGRLHITFLGPAPLLPHIASGAVRALGVTTAKESAVLPGVPPIARTIPDYDVAVWYGLAAPAGTADAVVDRISQAVLRSMKDPDLVKTYAQGGMSPEGTSPGRQHAYVESELRKWRDVVKAAGIKPE